MAEHFINGEWVRSASGETLDVIAPATGKIHDRIAAGDARDIDLAVRAARAAFDDGAWGRLTATDRGRLLLRLAALIESNGERLAEMESRDTGRPISAARADIVALARYFEFYGGGADKFHGEVIPYQAGFMVSVLREPHGVTGHILPWNYPAQMFGRTLAPALAMGNATVLKPAEDACATALELARLSLEADFPAGAINVVTGKGDSAGAALAAHPGIDYVSFTGSPEVGRIIQKLAADHFIPCTLELGGKSPHLVFADAPLDAAIPVVVRAIIQNAGQTCSAGSRVLIEQAIYDPFTERLAEAFSRVRVGSPEMDLDCGPIITAKQKQRVEGFVRRAREDGIPVLAEGTIDPGVDPDGFFVPPVLFGPVPRSNILAREEVFGPVLAAQPFTDEADAVQLANSTDYGLVAAIWTRDGGRQARVAKKLRAGQVFMNCYGAGAGIELPFGGSGKSGHGREKGFAALHDVSKSKTLVLNHG